MTLRRSWTTTLWTVAISAVFSAGAPHALACGATPPSYWTIGSTIPAAGGLIPPDGALIVRAMGSPASTGSVPMSFVVVEEGSADVIAGQSSAWLDSQPVVPGSSVVWTPSAPL